MTAINNPEKDLMPQRGSDLRNWKGSTSRIKVYFVGYPSAVLTS
jgi:hypothetical protein